MDSEDVGPRDAHQQRSAVAVSDLNPSGFLLQSIPRSDALLSASSNLEPREPRELFGRPSDAFEFGVDSSPPVTSTRDPPPFSSFSGFASARRAEESQLTDIVTAPLAAPRSVEKGDGRPVFEPSALECADYIDNNYYDTSYHLGGTRGVTANGTSETTRVTPVINNETPSYSQYSFPSNSYLIHNKSNNQHPPAEEPVSERGFHKTDREAMNRNTGIHSSDLSTSLWKFRGTGNHGTGNQTFSAVNDKLFQQYDYDPDE